MVTKSSGMLETICFGHLCVVGGLGQPTLMENVNYLRSQYSGRYEEEITSAFESEGYRINVSTLNSAVGVPRWGGEFSLLAQSLRLAICRRIPKILAC